MLHSLYAQDTWNFAPRWKTVLGARLEHWKASNGQTSNATTTVAHPERSETHLSPKAALAYQASQQWVLKASTGRAVRMPTVSELYQGGVNASGTLINNDPNLKPEDSWTTELTAERDAGNGLLRLTAFFERTKDGLFSQTNVTVIPNVTNIQNVDAIRTHGLEAASGGRLDQGAGAGLQPDVGGLDHHQERQVPASVGKWQPRVPRWRATLVTTPSGPMTEWSYTFQPRYREGKDPAHAGQAAALEGPPHPGASRTP